MEEGNNRAAYGQILIQEASACRIFIQLAMQIKTSRLAYRASSTEARLRLSTQ
jgi:hypothetical protein